MVEKNMRDSKEYLSEIPEAIIRLYPYLSDPKEFASFEKNPMLMFKKVKVCDDCFVSLNDIQQV